MTMGPDPYRATVGDFVRNRLSGTPNVFRLPVREADLFVARNFLRPDECRALIELIESNRVPSGLLPDEYMPGFRTSDSSDFDRAHPLVASVDGKINALLGIQPEHGETSQGQRYDVGQEFKAHHDFFNAQGSYYREQTASGGQRTWTAMVFLNDVEGGGQTFFPEVNLRITPRAGNLLAWNNMDRRGAPNRYTLHQGCPVTAGLKYVITKWYRERPRTG
ncbi:MAG: prolyl 4-hydroxylase [Sphingomonadales bacterium]|jgi:prolyl 4-hydroxylase|nr:prolyl 4-hydroxylase [Sphingomonadales bacterium]